MPVDTRHDRWRNLSVLRDGSHGVARAGQFMERDIDQIDDFVNIRIERDDQIGDAGLFPVSRCPIDGDMLGRPLDQQIETAIHIELYSFHEHHLVVPS